MNIKNIEEKLLKLEKRFENRKNLKKIIGILLIFIGIIGGFIPILQGWIFILFGCYLLFGEKFTKKIIKKFGRKKK